MWLAWDLALWMAAALAGVALVARRFEGPRPRVISLFSQEAALIMVLYAIWIVAGRLSVYDIEGAYDRAVWWWDLERRLLLPNEASVQQAVLPYGWFIQLNNGYYALVHVPAMVAMLIFMWVRHREHYSSLRNVLAASTGVCLLLQLLPVAPPRFVEAFDVVDTPALYGQSVYAALGYETAGQLQAMPSIHVAWALLVGLFGWRVGGPTRWWGLFHAVATFLVVTITGNHYWVDGLVAALLLLCIVPAERQLRTAARRLRHAWSSTADVSAGEIMSSGTVADVTHCAANPQIASYQNAP